MIQLTKNLTKLCTEMRVFRYPSDRKSESYGAGYEDAFMDAASKIESILEAREAAYQQGAKGMLDLLDKVHAVPGRVRVVPDDALPAPGASSDETDEDSTDTGSPHE